MTNLLSSKRVLVIGLDMGDGRLIREWIRAGRLPHFSALRSDGAWLELESPAEVLHTSTWPTFATGTLPGRHGVYYPYQPRPGYQLAQHIDGDQYGVGSFWKVAQAGGRRAVVYDVPETFPEPDFQGRAIFDWGTWAWYGEPTAQPAKLLNDLKSRFGTYPLGYEAKRLAFRVPDRIEQRLLRSVRYKAATASWLLEAGDWELAVVGLCETHPAGHYLWPSGAEIATAPDDPIFDPLCRVYTAIDAAIGMLREKLSSEVILLVVSGDGVRPNRCGWHLLPQVLDRLGFMGSGPRPASNGANPPRSSLVSRAHGLIPSSAKRLVTAALPWRVRDRLGVWLQTRGMDWSRTRAFTLPTDLEGCIRINVKGREPFGTVDPGGQYAQVCEEIRAGLEELENPATGRPAVRHVWLRNQIFPGPSEENLPDVIVTWNDDAPLDAVASPRIGVLEGRNADPRPGTHSTSGFALAAGPGIPAGTEVRGHLADVPASVLALLGVDPSALDGRPLAALTGESNGERMAVARSTTMTDSPRSGTERR